MTETLAVNQVAPITSVPQGWQTLPLRRIFRITGGATPKSDVAEYWDGEINWVTPADLGKTSSLEVHNSARTLTRAGLDSCAAELLPPGSIIVSVRAPIGAIGIAKVPMATNQGCKGLVGQSAEPRFMAYQLSVSQESLEAIGRGTTFTELSATDLGSFQVAVPPLDLQWTIADFLDRETAKIDALIDKQQQLIATLREDRAATITQAITKGLDQSVELHRTGIAVMDAIPSHWSVRKLKHLVERFEQGVSPQASAELATEGWGVLKSGCVNGGVFRDLEHKKLPRDFEFDGRLAVAVGDLLVCRASGSSNLVGSAAIVQEIRYQLILSDKIFRLTPSRGSLLGYLEWAMNARPYREQVLGAISGAEGLANNLPLSSLRNFWFAVPPIAEQQEIARFLGERCTKIDLLIAKSTAMIETLREYRSALITNAVTGKIDVREAV